MNKSWRKFEELSGMCYLNMIQPEPCKDIWDDTFSMLMENIDIGRKRDSNYARGEAFMGRKKNVNLI